MVRNDFADEFSIIPNEVFVRNLDEDIDAKTLETRFSDIGPVKNAFVVVETKGANTGKSKGYGFVTYALEVDAKEAVRKMNGVKLGKKLISVELAAKKGFKRPTTTTTTIVDNSLEKVSETKKYIRETNVDKEKVTEMDDQIRRSIILFNIPKEFGEKDIRKRVRKVGTVERLVVPAPGVHNGNIPFLTISEKNDDASESNSDSSENNNDNNDDDDDDDNNNSNHEKEENDESVEFGPNRTCLVRFEKLVDATKFITKFRERSWGGSNVVARRLKQVALNPSTQAHCRLIIRNLDFGISLVQVYKKFREFGPITDVHIPKNDSGASRGFGFVQFACRHDASLSILKMNEKVIGNRKVVIDWAVGKDSYEKLVVKSDDKTEKEEEEGDNEKEESIEKEEVAEVASSISEESDDSKSTSTAEEEEEEEEEAQATDEQKKPEYSLFIRNLLFETTENDLYSRFRSFGPIKSAKVVKDSNGRSRGSGFVSYFTENGVENALKEASEDPGILLAGRPLLVTRVVPKTDALLLRKPDGKKLAPKNVKNDKRHLYLSREGRIKPDSDAAKQTPSGDMKKREAGEKEKKKKLSSPLFFISPTRLSVRNLDRTLDTQLTEEKIRTLFLKAAIRGIKEGVIGKDEGDAELFPAGWPSKNGFPVKVTKVRLMRDVTPDDIEQDIIKTKSKIDKLSESNEGDVTGKTAAEIRAQLAQKKQLIQKKKSLIRSGRFTGSGFVEFSEHAHALAALRIVNNNPEFSWAAAGGIRSMNARASDRPRLIVEFSVENAAKLRKVRLRNEEAELNSKSKKVDENDEHTVASSSSEKEKKKKRQNRKQKLEKTELDDENIMNKKSKKQKIVKEESDTYVVPVKHEVVEEEEEQPLKKKKSKNKKKKHPVLEDDLDRVIQSRYVKQKKTSDVSLDATKVREIFEKNAASSIKTRWFE